MSDDELYRQYLNGDASAGDQLMLRYADALTAYLDRIDCIIKEKYQIRYYTRYMDDLILLHPDREILEHCLLALLSDGVRQGDPEAAHLEQAVLQAQAEEVSAAVRGRTDGSGSNQTQPRQLQRPPEPRPHLEAVQKNV